jgi:hypothetical protein
MKSGQSQKLQRCITRLTVARQTLLLRCSDTESPSLRAKLQRVLYYISATLEELRNLARGSTGSPETSASAKSQNDLGKSSSTSTPSPLWQTKLGLCFSHAGLHMETYNCYDWYYAVTLSKLLDGSYIALK